MPLTVTKDPKLSVSKFGTLLSRGSRIWSGTITFDSSYPIGGESISLPFTPDIAIIEPTFKYQFRYDHTNSKVKVLRPAVPLIVEEAVTVASNVGTLKHKPFYVLAIETTAGTTTDHFSVIPTGETPLTKQCAVTFTDGTLTFLAGDAVTAARVTYIPLQESGPFCSDNLVVDEAVTAAAAKATLANRAAAVQYVWDDTDGVIDGLEPVGEEPSATHKAVVDITNGSSETDVDFHGDDEGNSVKVTYVKYTAFQSIMQLGDDDVSAASEQYNWTENHYPHIVIPGLGTACVGETGEAGNVALVWAGPSGTLGAGKPVLDIRINDWQTDESTALATFAMPAILLNPITDGIGLMEEDRATDLSSVTARMMAIKV
jgi:hypothetical protein